MPPHPLPHPLPRLVDELLGFFRRRAPDDAEELAQETWLRVTAASITDAGLRPLLYTVARRLLIDRYRRSRVRGPLLALVDDGGPATTGDPHDALVAARAAAVIERCLAAMKPEVAEVFRWRTSADLSFADIAARQGCSLNTALGRHHHATRTIARALRDAGFGDP